MFRLREFSAVSLAAFVAAAGFLISKAALQPGAIQTSQESQTTAALFMPREPVRFAAIPIASVAIELHALPPHNFVVDGPALPPDAVAQAPLPPQSVTRDPASENDIAEAVAARIASKVPQTLTPYFDLFFYVSKAASGPWAQRLFIFNKNANGALVYEESFPVSTGREKAEQYFTVTPTGFFELDSHRFMPMARSAKWNDALMPWAMFLNYSYRTKMTGVALHAAIGHRELADLGHRASGGCVRLPLEKANALFHRIKATMGGQVPVFPFSEARGTTSTSGDLLRDAEGNVMVAYGYRVLVFIDNYPGTKAPRSPSA